MKCPKQASLCPLALIFIACASAKPAADSCPDIVGNYTISGNRTGGDCDPSLAIPASAPGSFAKAVDGTISIMIPGIEGGCPGTYDASCKFTATCHFLGKDGALLATASPAYAFAVDGSFTGTSIGAYNPPTVPKACTVTLQETGKKL